MCRLLFVLSLVIFTLPLSSQTSDDEGRAPRGSLTEWPHKTDIKLFVPLSWPPNKKSTAIQFYTFTVSLDLKRIIYAPQSVWELRDELGDELRRLIPSIDVYKKAVFITNLDKKSRLPGSIVRHNLLLTDNASLFGTIDVGMGRHALIMFTTFAVKLIYKFEGSPVKKKLLNGVSIVNTLGDYIPAMDGPNVLEISIKNRAGCTSSLNFVDSTSPLYMYGFSDNWSVGEIKKLDLIVVEGKADWRLWWNIGGTHKAGDAAAEPSGDKERAEEAGPSTRGEEETSPKRRRLDQDSAPRQEQSVADNEGQRNEGIEAVAPTQGEQQVRTPVTEVKTEHPSRHVEEENKQE